MKTLKRVLSIVVLLATACASHAATNDLTSLLQQGLFEEEANRNLDAAIANYQSLATQFDKDRQVAATAVFRLGEVYRKLGKTNEAVVQYQRILRDFSDQQTLATLSRQNLTGLGVSSSGSGLPPSSTQARQQQRSLLERQIQLMEQDLSEAQKRFDNGTASQAEVRTAEREVLRLRQQLAALDASQREDLLTLDVPPTDDEDKEIHRIQAMIQNSPDRINAPGGGPNGAGTPLMGAAQAGYLRVAAFLLDHGAEVNLKSGGETPLHAAVRSGNKTMTEFLLDHGADVNGRDGTGGTPLHIAAEAGFRAVAEVLLNHKADVNARNSQMNRERTPLHRAAASGNVEMMKLLIDHGADVNAKTSRGTTPLVDALGAGTLKPLVALLDAKADPNIADNGGQTPLSYAVGNFGNLEAVKALLAAKADPNKMHEDGRTPLSFAAEGGLMEIAKALLEAKADPNAGIRDLPLAAAIEATYVSRLRHVFPGTGKFPKEAICELLLRYGADPNKSAALRVKASLPKLSGDYPQGSTPSVSPIQLAVARREAEVVKLLLDHKADPNAVSTREVPLLFEAVTAENQEIAEALLAHSADVNARGWNKFTPLHAAIWSGKAGLVELLLDYKADVNARDANGRTALDNAKEAAARPTTDRKQWEDIAVLLRAHGALDNLPHLDRITLSRSSANFSAAAFSKWKNDWNHFTLLEALAENYGLINTSVSGEAPLVSGVASEIWGTNAIRFPNLNAVVIHRPSTDGKTWKDIQVNVADMLSSGDCSRDVLLQWGDVVEVPEADHPVAETWEGLSEQERKPLIKCISRTITISINNANTPITISPILILNGFFHTPGISSPILESRRQSVSFMVRSVLDQSKLIRFSSDLSRVKVTRHDSATGKTQSWVLDCSNPNAAPDLWLRDGDVVEVPEK